MVSKSDLDKSVCPAWKRIKNKGITLTKLAIILEVSDVTARNYLNCVKPMSVKFASKLDELLGLEEGDIYLEHRAWVKATTLGEVA